MFHLLLFVRTWTLKAGLGTYTGGFLCCALCGHFIAVACLLFVIFAVSHLGIASRAVREARNVVVKEEKGRGGRSGGLRNNFDHQD